MKNKEKFAKEILDIACDCKSIAVTKENKVVCCSDISCESCMFDSCSKHIGRSQTCYDRIREWAESEYVEKPTITSREKNFLDALLSDCKYIARDKDNSLYVYYDKPIRGNKFWISDYASHDMPKDMYGSIFDFIKWDDEEPWSIEDLKKLEVKEDTND